jgi:hypothetical protein
LGFHAVIVWEVEAAGRRTGRGAGGRGLEGEAMTGRYVVAAVGLGLVGLAVASPVPREQPAAAFPAGRYVLAGGVDAATGDDVLELKDKFRLRPNQYVLSGGKKPTDEIVVDDDLELLQGDKKLFVDDDTVASTERRGKLTARYQGQPIVLVLDREKPLHVRVTDHRPTEAVVGELWLHRYDGARKPLTRGVSQPSAPDLPHVFIDEKFDLKDGFERPAGVATDARTELPERPALLLPRFRTGR